MSDTPRTQAAAVPIYAIRAPQFPDGTYDKRGKWVPEGVCEKLERELNETKLQLGRMRNREEDMRGDRDKWRECARSLRFGVRKPEALQRFDELEKGME